MTRRVFAVLGGAVLVLVWMGPLPELAQRSFTAHMTMHMSVVSVAAPLLALGIAGTPLDPVRRVPSLFAPVLVSLLELLVVWGWHAPALHHAARGRAEMMALEQGSFLMTALLLWLAAYGGVRERRRERAGSGLVGLLLTSMHMTLLGALLGLAPRMLYERPVGDAGWMSPLRDQQVGGAIMLLVGGAVYLAGGLGLAAELLRDGSRGPSPRPTGGVPPGTALAREEGACGRPAPGPEATAGEPRSDGESGGSAVGRPVRVEGIR